MTLKEYTQAHSLTLKKLEALTGIDFRVLHRYITGQSLPSLKNAYKIYKSTKKRVKLEDWFEG
jgi:transcriptional regulator with XRE-family HTH domain